MCIRDRLEPVGNRAPSWALVAMSLLVMLCTKASPLWLVAAGALAGAVDWV